MEVKEVCGCEHVFLERSSAFTSPVEPVRVFEQFGSQFLVFQGGVLRLLCKPCLYRAVSLLTPSVREVKA